MPTWATNGTQLIPGGAALGEAMLLTSDGGLPQQEPGPVHNGAAGP